MTTDNKNLISFVFSMSLCIIAGFIASYPVSGSLDWYGTLNKSFLNPPEWIFGPVWGFMYALMGVSLWTVMKRRESPFYLFAFGLFMVQLVLNILWTYIFFGTTMVGYAYVEILILDAVVLITAVMFGKVSRAAQWMMLPYIIWLGFATYLNWHVMYYN